MRDGVSNFAWKFFCHDGERSLYLGSELFRVLYLRWSPSVRQRIAGC
jgi:hypothetical protein